MYSANNGTNLNLNIFLFVVISQMRELTMGCTPNSFQQFFIQGKTTIKSHVIYSLLAVSTLWGGELIFIPGLRAKDHDGFLCILLSDIIVINIWAEHFFYEAIFGNIFFVEGGIPFILLGILLYLFRNKVKFTIAYSSFSLFIYATYTKWGSGMNPIINYLVPYGSYQWMIAALPLLLLFNGKKGPRLKYFFYLFYPIHIIILYFIGISLR